MVEQYIEKNGIIESIERHLSENGEGYPAREILDEIKRLKPEKVVPQWMFRRSEYDLRHVLMELDTFEKGNDIVRCQRCKFANERDGRFYCPRFTLVSRKECEVPSNGYCFWGVPREEARE